MSIASRGSGVRQSPRGPGRLIEPFGILFRNRSLKWLVVAFGMVNVGEWGYVTAVAIYAFRRGGALAVGLVGLRLFFSAFVAFFTHPYVHRNAGVRVLVAIATGRATIVAVSCALVASGGPLAPLLALVVVDAMASAPYRPAQSAMIPQLARTPREVAASAAGMSISKTLGQAVGATGGGLLLEAIPLDSVLAGVSVAFMGAALMTLLTAHKQAHVTRTGKSGYFESLASDTVEALRTPHVPGLVTVSGLRTFIRGLWIAIAVIASLQLLHAGSAGVGLLMLAAGIGSLMAIPVSAALIDRSRLGTPAAVALVACGLPIGVIAGVPVLDVAMALLVAWGVGMAVADVATLSLLYRLLDIPLLPRVTAVIESSKLALEGLGALLAPLLVATVGIRGALVATAIPLPVAVVAGWGMLHRLDESAGDRARRLKLLHGQPCFEPLDMAALESLAGGTVRMCVPEGVDVVRQGDPADRFYMVESGSADVLVDGFFVSSIEQGAGFGERALLRTVNRTATIRSRGPMQLLALSREDFLTALTGEAEPGEPLTMDLVLAGGAGHLTVRQKAEILARVPLFSHLDSKELELLAGHCVTDCWPAGSSIIQEGDDGDRFFLLLSGRAAVSIGGRQVNELHPGEQFGEIALLHSVPRTASVTASVEVVTLSLRRDDFVSAVRSRVLLG